MSESPVSLEALLKLKRLEQPDREFWEDFEQDFQHRRLRALMEDSTPSVGFGLAFWRRLLVWSPFAVGGLAAVAFFMAPSLAIQDGSEALVAEESQNLSPTQVFQSHAEPLSAMVSSEIARSMEAIRVQDLFSFHEAAGRSQFVQDALATKEEARHFRRVLSNAALSVPTSAGSRYVADPLTAGRADASSAVLRPGSHF